MVNAKTIYEKIEELIDFYEKYLIKNKDAFLNVNLDNNNINFYIQDNDKEDNLILTFNNREKDLLDYLSMKIIIKIFGNVNMHLDGITLFNKHKENIKINVLNERIMPYINIILDILDHEYINDHLSFVQNLAKKAKKVYSSSFYHELDERVKISQNIFKTNYERKRSL